MEAQLFIYFAKVNVALFIFYLLYIALLKRDTFIRLRRFYLLSMILFAVVYPFFGIKALSEMFAFPQSSQTAGTAVITLGNPIVSLAEEGSAIATGLAVSPKAIAIGLLALGSLILAFRLIMQVISIAKISRQCQKRVISTHKIFDTSQEITPFSFFKWIILNTEAYSDEELQQILLHESTHAQQWHSADILLAELLCVFFWWNPAVWLLKREIAINLEYLADNDVLSHGINSREYQYHLLKLTYRDPVVGIGNNFNVSQLKQRIMMMNKSKSPAFELAKYLLVLPLAFMLITANSCMNNETKSEKTATTEIEIPITNSEDASTAQILGEKSAEEIFMVVENMPEFPGGNSKMMKFLSDSIKYPIEAQETNIQGRVVVNFVVEKDGSLSDFQVIRGVDPALDAEALRVLKAMPNWKPGKQKGEEVRVRFTLPIMFRLQGEDEKTSKNAPPPPPPPPADLKTAEELKSTNEVFMVVEKEPEFIGGNTAMMKFLSDNITYPAEAQEKNIQGRVIVNFVVEKDGSISDIQVARGVDPLLNEEAIRIIKSMPNWKPGTHKGQNVRVRFTLPVTFRLQE